MKMERQKLFMGCVNMYTNFKCCYGLWTVYKNFNISEPVLLIFQLNFLLLMCRINSYKANYRHSTV
jgi:intracellular septation protein A